VSRGLQVSIQPLESSFLEVPFHYNLFGVVHVRVRWAAVNRYLCPYGSPGYLHSSFRRGAGLVSPATPADSATLARVDEFLMNSRRNF
jgi:hypothetical protein